MDVQYIAVVYRITVRERTLLAGAHIVTVQGLEQ